MPRLVLLNGAPASGKSTLARRWSDAHPGSVVVDVDAVRATIAGWADDPQASGLLARQMALGMIDAALADARDVLVPQFLARPEFWDALELAAGARGAVFLAVVLEAAPEELAARFAARTAPVGTGAALDPLHVDAAALQSASGADVRDQQERMLALASARPGVVRIRSRAGEVAAALTELSAAIDAAG